jgi:hypothetical protein
VGQIQSQAWGRGLSAHGFFFLLNQHYSGVQDLHLWFGGQPQIQRILKLEHIFFKSFNFSEF